MNLTELHHRLLADVLDVGGDHALVLAGGCAVQAHGLVDRPGRDVDVATESPAAMKGIAAAVRAGLWQRGWQVAKLDVDPVSAQLIVTEPVGGAVCELGLRKEVLWRLPVRTPLGPALSLEDVVGTQVRALAALGLVRDLVDVRAAVGHWSYVELEELGRRHAPDSFDLVELQARLEGADWVDDAEFAAYGLGEGDVPVLRSWAQAWANDIAERLLEEGTPPPEG
ncbi:MULTISPECIES: nucleotidyl transferase AbiEii/AbiGii toxin family protein [Streptomyces]|uniref:nucleotidyl transferase AbiEii/AbiGii toxin family protein n=1 Tax=Streptomyces TaxID=1883 RepID=UPI0015878E7F|nr:nucleotidyl transferase AbiEii/AbiGii toxin family protein [Streptomyces sp. CAI-155]NUV78763.1 nucleotidyl transferase AbiEii/AbiGii toxin family protein [Streptomyces sp. CAI-155]